MGEPFAGAMTHFTVICPIGIEHGRMRRLLLLLLLVWLVGSPAAASDARYTGRPLVANYDGPVLVHNSHYRYTGSDRLSFSTTDLLAERYPELRPLRPVIDTWASRFSIHPRVLSAVAHDFFAGSPVLGDRRDIEAVVQVASALATVFEAQTPHPLAASRAVAAAADALFFRLWLPADLAKGRETVTALGEAPALFGYFQPPWEIGETWAGGGAHGNSHNALDFWATYQQWGDDTSPYWVSAMQSGTVRVWSSCGMAVIHPNGWVTDYYHLDNIQLADFATAQRNDQLANYASTEAQAICSGGWSTGPHVHMSIRYNGDAVSVDEANVDFTAFSHHAGEGDYDTNCTRSWYTHFTEGTICPNRDQLLNNAQDPVSIFLDGFEIGSTSNWSATVE